MGGGVTERRSTVFNLTPDHVTCTHLLEFVCVKNYVAMYRCMWCGAPGAYGTDEQLMCVLDELAAMGVTVTPAVT